MRKLFFAAAVVSLAVWNLNVSYAAEPEPVLTSSGVERLVDRVCDWQLEAYPRMDEKRVWKSAGDLSWENGVFLSALSRWAEYTKDVQLTEWYEKVCACNYYGTSQKWLSIYHADDFAVCMMYVTLYDKKKDPRILQHTRARLDYTLHYPSDIQFGDTTSRKFDRWTWCDALYMAPPVYAAFSRITGDDSYLRFMDKEYQATYDYLFDKEEQLFYRDHTYFGKREKNGKKVFWGRGNAWVAGGLCLLLEQMPADYPSKPRYESLLVTLLKRVAPLQRESGYWSASMLDPEAYPNPETSSTGFFTFALLWAVNHGLLPEDAYIGHAMKGWKALTEAIREDGMLGWVQPVGASPETVTADMTEVYGAGAMMLAGEQLMRYIGKK